LYKPKRRININIRINGIIKEQGIDVMIIKGISDIISVSKKMIPIKKKYSRSTENPDFDL